jgi:hypothetical protein
MKEGPMDEVAETAIAQLRELAAETANAPRDELVLSAGLLSDLARNSADAIEHVVKRARRAERDHQAMLEELGRT